MDALIKKASIGTRLARVRYATQPAKFQQFDALTYRRAGRDGRYQQALDFESVWKTVEPTWTFKPDPAGPVLTLGQFTTWRDIIVTTRQVNHSELVRNESHERSKLHVMADDLNGISVRWYEAATTQYAVGTVAGNLIRTIPTTYDPNRAPGR